MLGRIALGLLIFFGLTFIIGEASSTKRHSTSLAVFIVLVMVAYISVTAVYFLTKFGYV